MKIIKRSGAEVDYDISKIIAAVQKANESVPASERMTQEQILRISDKVRRTCEEMNRALNVEEIQDLDQQELIKEKK